MTIDTESAPAGSSTDRIEKRAVLRAPRSRVWRALTDAREFGQWFRVRLEGEFLEGARVQGQITYAGYEHLRMEVWVEQIAPERRFAFRWHPYPVEPGGHAGEPTTLVEFLLEEVEGGTALTIVESGFDRLPPGRRDEAFRMNEGGWATQLDNIAGHVASV